MHMSRRPWLLALTIGCMSVAPLAAHAGVFGSNLIVNGDAEAEGATSDIVIPVTGWTSTGTFTALSYSIGGGFPAAGDPGVSVGGNNFFTGGNSAVISTGTQSVDLSSGASSIDAGTASYNLSGYLGGFLTQDDNATLTVSFLNGLDAVVGTAVIGPVLAADRDDATGLLLRDTSGLVPVGTRSVGIELLMTKAVGFDNDGYADNLSLVLQPGVGGAVPEPATWAVMLMGFGALGASLRARRARVLA
jgi:hypothetical protein